MINKLVIGLTGNIATGKSAIMAMAAERGAETIDADKVAHTILRSAFVKHDVLLLFGSGVFGADGEIDRPTLGKVVFSDPQKMRELEGITHPAIRREIGQRITNSEAAIVMVEAIKLLEGPLKDHCDQVWVTACSAEIQIARLIQYRQSTAEDAARRVNAQSPQADKVALADVVIDTNGTMDETVQQFLTAWEQLPA